MSGTLHIIDKFSFLISNARICKHASSKVDYLDLKRERGVGRNDTTSALSTISVVRWAGQDGLLSFLELADALVPTPDHFSDADVELEGLTAGDARVEDGAIGELACVVNFNFGALGDAGARTFVELLHFESWCA